MLKLCKLHIIGFSRGAGSEGDYHEILILQRLCLNKDQTLICPLLFPVTMGVSKDCATSRCCWSSSYCSKLEGLPADRVTCCIVRAGIQKFFSLKVTTSGHLPIDRNTCCGRQLTHGPSVTGLSISSLSPYSSKWSRVQYHCERVSAQAVNLSRLVFAG